MTAVSGTLGAKSGLLGGLSIETEQDFLALCDAVSVESSVPLAFLFVVTRKPQICRARQIVFYLLHEGAGWSFPRIADRFRMNHSTVFSGVETIKRALARDQRRKALANG